MMIASVTNSSGLTPKGLSNIHRSVDGDDDESRTLGENTSLPTENTSKA